MRTMLKVPDRLRVGAPSRPVGVDKEKRILRGMVVAQAGPFKSDGRGEFDDVSLQAIVAKWPANGLRSRFAHPNESDDGLGKFLGRARNPYLSEVQIDGRTIPAVRADLYLSPTAFDANPNGNLGQYILDLAASDPAALSSSLVLQKKEEWRINPDGTKALDEGGRPLPPLWRVERLFATDVVDEGDAVDGILSPSVESMRHTRDYISTGETLIDKLFAGQTREVVEARLRAYLSRYLDRRYGRSDQMAKLGAALGGVLDGYITAAETEERTRVAILDEMAQAAGLDVVAVEAIVAGTSDEGVTTPVLEAFAGVLGCPLSELVAAAEEDGIVLTASEGDATDGDVADGTDQPTSEPTPEAVPMSSNPKTLRRRLDLKLKAT